MFDSAYIMTTCPKCGQVAETECQTKQLDCILDVWHPGDLVDTERKSIYCITNCECGEFFDVIIYLEEGRLTNNYKLIERL